MWFLLPTPGEEQSRTDWATHISIMFAPNKNHDKPADLAYRHIRTPSLFYYHAIAVANLPQTLKQPKAQLHMLLDACVKLPCTVAQD